MLLLLRALLGVPKDANDFAVKTSNTSSHTSRTPSHTSCAPSCILPRTSNAPSHISSTHSRSFNSVAHDGADGQESNPQAMYQHAALRDDSRYSVYADNGQPPLLVVSSSF